MAPATLSGRLWVPGLCGGMCGCGPEVGADVNEHRVSGLEVAQPPQHSWNGMPTMERLPPWSAGSPHEAPMAGGRRWELLVDEKERVGMARLGGYFKRELQELQQLPSPSRGAADGARPKHTFASGATYEGQWSGRRRHGLGTQVWPDGARYTGRWHADDAEGLGQFLHPDGTGYTGQWVRGAAHGVGVGTLQSPDGLKTYRGQWAEDLQHGEGVEQVKEGLVYRGQFRGGRKDGYGVYQWPDGSRYCGHWGNGEINGHGHYSGGNGQEFRGEWRSATAHGCGVYTWQDGRRFWGQYAEDKKHGFGVFSWVDGRRFEGFWKEDQQHGPGRAFKGGGEVLKEGRWCLGKFDAALEGLAGGGTELGVPRRHAPVTEVRGVGCLFCSKKNRRRATA